MWGGLVETRALFVENARLFEKSRRFLSTRSASGRGVVACEEVARPIQHAVEGGAGVKFPRVSLFNLRELFTFAEKRFVINR